MLATWLGRDCRWTLRPSRRHSIQSPRGKFYKLAGRSGVDLLFVEDSYRLEILGLVDLTAVEATNVIDSIAAGNLLSFMVSAGAFHIANIPIVRKSKYLSSLNCWIWCAYFGGAAGCSFT